jgi:hypothetical protein
MCSYYDMMLFTIEYRISPPLTGANFLSSGLYTLRNKVLGMPMAYDQLSLNKLLAIFLTKPIFLVACTLKFTTSPIFTNHKF